MQVICIEVKFFFFFPVKRLSCMLKSVAGYTSGFQVFTEMCKQKQWFSVEGRNKSVYNTNKI